jgi:hypothetical protein
VVPAVWTARVDRMGCLAGLFCGQASVGAVGRTRQGNCMEAFG